MNENDLVRLRHMLDAAREAVEFAQNRTQKDLFENRMFNPFPDKTGGNYRGGGNQCFSGNSTKIPSNPLAKCRQNQKSPYSRLF